MSSRLAHRRGVGEPAAAGKRIEHERGLEPSRTVSVLVEREMREAVAEVQRRPHPERLRHAPGPVRLDALADGPHAPRPVTRAGHVGRVDAQLRAVDDDRAGPRAPLREPRVVHHEHTVVVDAALPRFLDRDRRRVEGQVRLDAVLVALDDVADRTKRFDDLDADRPDRRRPVERHRTGREHRVFDAVTHEAERAVHHAPDGVVAHRRAEVEVTVALVAVEPVAVVVVGIAGRRMGDGIRRRVDRVVVERAQHVVSSSFELGGPTLDVGDERLAQVRGVDVDVLCERFRFQCLRE